MQADLGVAVRVYVVEAAVEAEAAPVHPPRPRREVLRFMLQYRNVATPPPPELESLSAQAPQRPLSMSGMPLRSVARPSCA